MTLTEYTDMLRFGLYVGVKVAPTSMNVLSEIVMRTNVKNMVDFDDVTVPLLTSINTGNHGSISLTSFHPSNRLYEATIVDFKVDEFNRLVLRLFSTELDSRYNALLDYGFNDSLSNFKNFFSPYLVISEEYQSEKLNNSILVGKKIQLQGEVFEALHPNKKINGLTLI